MNRTLQDVIPIGTPWGGPESVRYLSSFVSMLMHIEASAGTEKELHAEHERRYFLFLAVSGIGMSTAWTGSVNGSDELAPRSHDEMVDRLFPDYVERTMTYAGYRYSELRADEIRANKAAVERKIVGAIDKGIPVLACSRAHEWSIVTGYDDGGDVLIGWDGAHTYWGPPAIKPDGYLENQMFATGSWPDAVSRLVFSEGPATPRRSTREVIEHLIATMDRQRPKGYDREFKQFAADDAYCRSVDADGIRRLWNYVNDYVGWYAESRCFSAFAFDDILPSMEDMAANKAAVECLKPAAGFMFHTHDLCWESWRALRVEHKCGLPDDEPCRMCAGCLRPGNDEDYEAFRGPAMRRKVIGYLQTIAWNDSKALAALRKCAELL